MHYDHPPTGALPPFDTMPTLSDENIGDMLQLLLAFVDAYENHYADPLRRWREKQCRELHEDFDDRQLNLPVVQRIDDPF